MSLGWRNLGLCLPLNCLPAVRPKDLLYSVGVKHFQPATKPVYTMDLENKAQTGSG